VETHLLAVGKLRPSYRAACDDYLRRLRRYGPMVEREVREAQRAGSPALRRREESARLLGVVPERALVVALDRGGTGWTSEELAHRLERWRTGGRPLALLIGGAFGLDPELLRGAAARWSLGPLTLPHELARVVVTEQWYRAWTILRGEPYHKGGTT
jgi:23S rRNA (pseudouridine1915-N3)-methyltransferase